MIRIFFLLFTVFFAAPLFSESYQQEIDFHKARIESITKTEKHDKEAVYNETVFTVKLLDGDHKGEIRSVTYKIDESVPNYMKYKTGDVIFVGLNRIYQRNVKDEYIAFYDIDNSKGILILLAIAVITLFIIGRLRGMMSIAGLAVTVLLIFFVFIPLTLKGYSPLLLALLIAIASILFTIPIITGISKKALTAIAGASAGVAVAIIMSIAFGWTMHLSGIVTDELLTVFYISTANINLRDIALAGMILSALGAVMDIAVSISSAINEFFVVHPDVEFKTAFKSAMEVGRDNLGSMVNTLIMAYVGSSISLMLIIYLRYDSNMPLAMIFSHNEILIEILKSFVGCMGMFVAVPVTAFVGVELNMRHRKRKQ